MSRVERSKWVGPVAIIFVSILILGALIEIRLGHLHALGIRVVVVIIFVAIGVLIARVSLRKGRK